MQPSVFIVLEHSMCDVGEPKKWRLRCNSAETVGRGMEPAGH